MFVAGDGAKHFVAALAVVVETGYWRAEARVDVVREKCLAPTALLSEQR
jgi:hypothetical protein